jgi:predicted nuclease of predicted toxin-antitoxin system
VRLLFDQNLPRSLVRRLAAEYPGSDHVALLGMAEASDREIWEHAGAAGFMVVSKDSDFRQ